MNGYEHDGADAGDTDPLSPAPVPPGSARRVYADLKDSLLARAAGQEKTAQSLALVGTRHLLGASMQRVLLIGPPGSGRTALARQLAKLLHRPYVEIPVGLMSEEGWAGTSASDYLRGLVADAGAQIDSATVARDAAERGVVLLSGLDQARLTGRYASAATAEQREGKQRSLAPLLGDGVIGIARSLQPPILWRSARALVIATASFPELHKQPSADDYVGWGFLPEVAVPLARAISLHLEMQEARSVLDAVGLNLPDLHALFADLGYQLEVPAGTVTYVVSRLMANASDVTSDAATACLALAARRVLLRLLERDAPDGTRHVLSPDDIQIPSPSRGLWRE